MKSFETEFHAAFTLYIGICCSMNNIQELFHVAFCRLCSVKEFKTGG